MRREKGERGIWQRRYWEHYIRDERDFRNHVAYCYYNPVKHDLVANMRDWPHSTYHRDIRAKRSVGIHWGTFEMSDESLDQPPIDLALAASAQGLASHAFTVMAIGETRFLPARAMP